MNIQTLSPSMVNSYLKCSLGFFYQNVAQLPWISSPVLALGSAFHETVRENAFQKRTTFKDLPEDLLTDFFAGELEMADDVEWEGDGLSTTKDQGVICIRDYRQNRAPLVQPAMVEHVFNMAIKRRAWAITGKVDLVTDAKLVIDHKTTKGQMKKPKDDHVFQIGVYTLAVRRIEGFSDAEAEIDYYPRGKAESYSRPVSFPDTLEKSVLTTFDQVANGINKEVWIANRTHYLCSRKYCSYWNQCEKDCGDVVKP